MLWEGKRPYVWLHKLVRVLVIAGETAVYQTPFLLFECAERLQKSGRLLQSGSSMFPLPSPLGYNEVIIGMQESKQVKNDRDSNNIQITQTS
jgi:hypothetical protein